jgi:exosortase
LLWAPLIWRVAPVWNASPEQAYGWGVPLLALYLAAERARRAPPARALGGGARVAAWAVLVVALASLPVWLTILEADPTWPLLQWTAFAATGAATFAGLALDDGAARARHLAFPVLFFATALTWPTAVTTTVVATLVSANAQLAAAVVSTFGPPAVVSGNVIEVSTGFVGIDEACSGLRSLQAVWMAGWFFGELFSLRWRRRLALVAAAGGVAVVGNWMRTTALTWLAAVRSPAAVEQWHDRAGTLELIGTLAAVALVARSFARRSGVRPRGAPAAVLLAGRAGRIAIVGGVLAGGVPAAWYAWHEARASAVKVEWELVPPGAEWTDYEIPERARELLRPSSWFGFVRAEPASGGRSFALLVNWDDGNAAALNAEVHDPTICLPAAGIAMQPAAEPEEIVIGGVPLDFTVGRFNAGGREHRVYYCHWDDWLGRARNAHGGKPAEHLRSWRLERAWLGQRRAGAAYLAFVTPVADDDAGRAWLRAWAPKLLRRR